MNTSMNKTFWDYFKVNFHWFLTVNLIYSFVFLHLLSFFASDFYGKLIYSSFLISISSFLGIWAIVLMMQLINHCIVTPYKPRVAPTIYAKSVEPANVEEIQRMISNAQNIMMSNTQNMLYNAPIVTAIQRQRDATLTGNVAGDNYVAHDGRIQEEQNYAIRASENYLDYVRRMRLEGDYRRRMEEQRHDNLFRFYAEQYNRPNPIITSQDYPRDYMNSFNDTLKSLESKKNVDLEFID